MKNTFPKILGFGAMLLVAHAPAIAQSDAKKAAVVIPAVSETNLKKNVFAGSESQIAAMNFVKADCTSGPLPDVRIVTAPSKGDIRLETVQHAVDRAKGNSREHCNGKLVDAVGVFYKAKEGQTGAARDKLVLDVDFKNGTVNRYIYTVDIR
jgi:hypothetical protein